MNYFNKNTKNIFGAIEGTADCVKSWIYRENKNSFDLLTPLEFHLVILYKNNNSNNTNTEYFFICIK